MHQVLSHYVNSSGSNWDTMIPFYLMAYRATHHGSAGFSPYYLLHGREMILPTTQSITAKLSPEVTGADQVAKLENLKSRLKTAYKLVRQNIHKSYQSNKRYYDGTAKERIFSVGDVVYLFCPATKPGHCRKLQKKWAGPFRIVAKVSKLNYRIVNPQGKEFTVHVNRLKLANNHGIWQATLGRKPPRKDKVRRRAVQEDEEAVCSPGPITVPVPRAENITRNSPRRLDNPAASPPTSSTSRSERTDPSYVPPDTPRSRREFVTARSQLPLTRLGLRM
jgi:hypothetical protein